MIICITKMAGIHTDIKGIEINWKLCRQIWDMKQKKRCNLTATEGIIGIFPKEKYDRHDLNMANGIQQSAPTYDTTGESWWQVSSL